MSAEGEVKLKSFLEYHADLTWMVGQPIIEKMQEHLEHLQKIAGAVEFFERKSAIALNDSKDPGILGYEYHMHKYDIAKAAAKRLRKKFNTEINETQL